MAGKTIKANWSVDKDGNKVDVLSPLREGVHYVYDDGTEQTMWNVYHLNADGSKETKAQKFKRLYGKEYDESLSFQMNVYKARGYLN